MARNNFKSFEREDDEDTRKSKQFGKGPKHSRNIPGRGMRVINSWCEEEDLLDLDYELDVYPTHNQR